MMQPVMDTPWEAACSRVQFIILRYRLWLDDMIFEVWIVELGVIGLVLPSKIAGSQVCFWEDLSSPWEAYIASCMALVVLPHPISVAIL